MFVLKLLVLLQLRDHPLLQPDAGLDTTAYVQLAERVLAGDVWLGPGLYYVSPLYVYFLAGALAIVHSFTAVRVGQIALGTVSIALIFMTARAWFGPRAAWLAAACATLTGLFTFYESILLQAALDPFLTSTALAALTLALTRVSPRWLVASGMVFGVASLNRPNMALAAIAIAAALVAVRRVRWAVLLVAGIAAGMAPAAIRNAAVAHQWSLVSSHGGLNFYIGNGPGATGFYRAFPGITPDISGQQQDARRVAERAIGRPVSDAEASDYFFRLAWTWIGEHPVAAAGLFARKLLYTFSAQHVALPHSYPFYAYDAKTILRFFAIGPWLLVPLGLAGLVVAAPAARRRDYLIWAAFVPGYAIAVAAFFVAERYRLPLMVPLSIGAGAVLDRTIDAIVERQARLLLVPAVAATSIAVAVNWPLGLHDGRWEEGLRMAQRLVILGRYEEADEWARIIEPRSPRPGATDYGIGVQLLERNEAERALPHLARAQELDPAQPHIEYALGRALLKNGRATDAIPYLQRGFDSGIELPLGGYDLALALQSVGDFPRAVSVIRRIAPPEDDPDAWLRLGRLAAQVKAPEVADPFFRRAVQLQPDEAGSHQQLGLNLLVLRRFPEAAEELAIAARLNPRDPDTLSRLAYCELELGRHDDAGAHAAAALSLAPDDQLAKQLLGVLKIR